ncbi:MAG: 23S rRNA (adenine(2503)-C(2))-methyltransferase RlmN [Micrococcales bacterium]|nr:23S rRNA (adenine(2503)-C(2))-methyltransferase RlmN [Micrococcales bacterium]
MVDRRDSGLAGRLVPPQHLAGLSPAERDAWVVAEGQPKMRGRQLAQHYFAHLTADQAAMTDLPAASRSQLVQLFLPQLLQVHRQQRCDQGHTVKTHYKLFDGAAIETVIMAYPKRTTVCISSQAGCAIGCPFCATGQMGLVRNLSAGEIVDQVHQAAALIQQGGLPKTAHRRLSNVAVLGMGEPLANYKPLVTALRNINAEPPDGLGISARKVTVSTCGLVPGIERLGGEGLPVRLALSLHAPDNALRNQLVPINTKYPVERVIEAVHGYFLATGRRVSIEYALISGVNDQVWRADMLAQKLGQFGTHWVHVNPIELNPVDNSQWTASKPAVQERFLAALAATGIAVSLRATRGQQIDGACGQLAAKA